MKFYERLKELRLDNELSQKELAERIGVQRTTISRYESVDEKNRIEPTLDKLVELSNVFDCSLDYLLGKSDVKNAPDYLKIDLDPNKPITAKDLERLIVSERLGHSSIKITLDTYSHMIPDLQEQALSGIDIKQLQHMDID